MLAVFFCVLSATLGLSAAVTTGRGWVPVATVAALVLGSVGFGVLACLAAGVL